MLKLAPGLIRIPDVSYISRSRLAPRRVEGVAVPELVPDLVIEVLPGFTIPLAGFFDEPNWLNSP